MKNYLLILGIVSALLINACSQEPEQSAVQPKVIISEEDSAVEAPQKSENPATSVKEENPKPWSQAPANDSPKEQSGNAVEKTAAPVPSVKEFDIIAKKFEFIPSTIKVNKGDKVKLSIKSIDTAHGFAISEFNINENIKPGVTKTIEFVADKTGEFTFFCSVYCGTGHSSMKGKLIVE